MRAKKKVFESVISIILIAGGFIFTACGAEKNKDRICVVTREEGSGTRGAFVELTGIQEIDANGNKVDCTTVDALSVNSTAITMTTVSENKRAIGYISLGSINDTVKAVQIDGAEPIADNIRNGRYNLARPLYVVTKGYLQSSAQDFFNFILSAEGQKKVAEQGYIEVENTGTFTCNGASGKVIIAGSSSVNPIMQKLQEAYQKVNSKVRIEVQESDSTTGINSVINETCEIGMISRELKKEEIRQGLVSTAIAIDGIVVVVHRENKINNLTIGEVKDIFTGEITEWSELGNGKN